MPISEVFCEDNMIGMARYPDKFFDLAIVDPPYGIDRFKKNVESKTRKTFTNKLNVWDKVPNIEYFTELFRVSKHQIIWGANHFWSKGLPDCPHFIFWDKKQPVSNFADGELAWTSFKGVCRKVEYPYYGNIEGKSNGTIRVHPTQKPVHLYKWLLTNYAQPGDKILDTHMGSQSSRIAAYNMGFDYWGWEIDNEYFEAGNKRFAEQTAQQQLFT